MRKDKLLRIANDICWATSFEYDTIMGPENKVVRKQLKTWTFTEEQLKDFVKEIAKDTLSKYEIIE